MMKVTKKCVLVPYDKYMRLTQNTTTTNTSQQGQSLSGDDTKDGYNEKIDIESDVHNNDSINTHQPISSELEDDIILQSIPATLRKKAALLINYLHKQPVITWNREGKLIVHDKVIEHTHIADLVKDALVSYKHFKPVGSDVFYQNLGNIPLSLISNPDRRVIVQEGRGVKVISAPPPGLPDKTPSISLLKVKEKTIRTKKVKETKRKKNTWKAQWKSLL